MSGFVKRILAFGLSVVLAGPTLSQELGALARFEKGAVQDRWGGSELRLEISQGVPWRLFMLSNPNRLVMDFREVQWGNADTAALDNSDRIAGIRIGGYRPGWSRLVADLSEPLIVESAELVTDTSDGSATITVLLEPVDQASFDLTAGAPRDPRWDLPAAAIVNAVPSRDPDRVSVVLDPGHGGIDPGAERDGITEADLMLTFGLELQDVLRRAGGFDVRLTRDGDYFVSLEARVAAARNAGADVFISLHADALAEGEARGAAVYVLSDEASDAASAALAERHNRDDLLANVLMSLARLDNAPRSEALAKHMLDGIRNAVGRVHKRPLRSAGFSVLKAADIPSVLLEVGFLSTAEDLKNLSDPIWRQGMAAGIRDGLIAWRDEDRALAPLRRN